MSSSPSTEDNKDVMRAAHRIAFDMYDEEAAKNPSFKKIYTHWKEFGQSAQQWFKVAEASFANFVYFTK